MAESRKPTRWEKVYIFISSTFNDMHAERDYLVKRVFPELQDWCERRKLRLVDIDLRWGVTEQDATHNKNVVKVCLNRIDDCRPFFLCFLGQRRGWVPKEDEVSPETFDAFPDLRPVVGSASVTEMEILHALINPFHQSLPRDVAKPVEYYERAKYAFFYLRDPSYLDQLPNEPTMLRQTYTNEWIEDSAERLNHDRALEKWRDVDIPGSHRPFHLYDVKWDPSAQTPELRLPLQCASVEPANIERWRRLWQKAGVNATGLDVEDDPAGAVRGREFNSRLSAGRLTDFTCDQAELSKVIIDELKDAISKRFPYHAEVEQKDELQTEIDQQERFLFVNSEGFIERAGDFADLDDYAANNSNKLFVLTAPGGMGKTMLLANWVDRYRTRIQGSPVESIHFRFIGASDRSTTVYSLLRFLLREVKEIAGKFDEEIPDDTIKLRQAWLESLSTIGKRGKTVIVIDALNQLETGLTELAWLPQTLPQNVKLIASFKRDDEASEELYRQWKGAHVLMSEVKAFEHLHDRRRLVNAYLEQYLKELDERHLEALIEADGASNPLYLKVVLSELRVFGAFANLAEKIRSDFGSTPVTAFQAVLERLETDPTYSPCKSEDAVPLLFGLLAHARRGLSADELIDLFVQELGLDDTHRSREAAADTINLLLRQVRPFLARREGRYDFFYESFKIAAQQSYVAESSADQHPKRSANEWHRFLARYFRRRADPTSDRTWAGGYPRGLRDLPHHMLQGQLYDELFQLARDESFLTAQACSFQGEPQLPLETVQASIEGAARMDDAARMAEFVLAHARRITGISSESPLDALRANQVERAWELADLYDLERGVLWHLLLSWESKDTGRLGHARATLDRLLRKELPLLSHWQPYAAYLLAHTYGLNDAVFTALQRRLLGDSDRSDLCKRLAACGYSADALKIADGIGEEWHRIDALRGIAAAQAVSGESEAARASFAVAVRTAQGIRLDVDRAAALRTIAIAQSRAGEAHGARTTLAAALQTAQGIGNEWNRTKSLQEIAVARAQAGEFVDAVETASSIPDEWSRERAFGEVAVTQAHAGKFADAVHIAKVISQAGARARVLTEIAVAQATAGAFSAATASFDAAVQTAQLMDDDTGRWNMLVDIALAQARAGQLEAAKATIAAAIQTANGISREKDRATAKRYIAAAQAKMGDCAEALKTADQIADELTRAEALGKIAGEQAQAGDRAGAKVTFAAALETAQRINYAEGRIEALREIAGAQARAGEPDAAAAAFAAALEAAREIREFVPEMKERAAAQGRIAVAQGESGDLIAALQTAQGISDDLKRTDALMVIAGEYARAGKFASALQVVRAAGSHEEQVRVLEAIARAYEETTEDEAVAVPFNAAEAIDYEASRAELISEISLAPVGAESAEKARTTLASALNATPADNSSRFQAEALVSIVTTQAQAGEFAAALKTAHEINSDAMLSKALRSIAVTQASAAGGESTASTYAAAVEIARGIGSPELRAEAGGAIAAAKGQALQFVTVYQNELGATHQVTLAGLRAIAEAGAAIAVGQAEAGNLSAAFNTAQGISSPVLRALALTEIALAQVRAQEIEAAGSSVAASLKIAKGIGDEFERSDLLRRIATVQAKMHEFADAVKTAQLVVPAFRDSTLNLIAVEQAEAGDFWGSFESVEEIGQESYRAEALGAIAAAQVQAEEIEAAKDTFAEALSTADGISHDASRARAKGRIAATQLQAGQTDAAEASISDTLEIAREIGEEAEVLTAIALAQARSGSCERAIASAGRILTGRNKHLPEIATALLDLGDREHFKQLLSPCAYYLDAAYSMCALLARSYPRQASSVAELLYTSGEARDAKRLAKDSSKDVDAADTVDVVAEAEKVPSKTEAPPLAYLRLNSPDGLGHRPGHFLGFVTRESESTITLAPMLRHGREPFLQETFSKTENQTCMRYSVSLPTGALFQNVLGVSSASKHAVAIKLNAGNSLGLVEGMYSGFVVLETDSSITMTPTILRDGGPWQPAIFDKASIASLQYFTIETDQGGDTSADS